VYQFELDVLFRLEGFFFELAMRKIFKNKTIHEKIPSLWMEKYEYYFEYPVFKVL